MRFKSYENMHAHKKATLKLSSYISNESVLLTIKTKELQETATCRMTVLKITGSLAFFYVFFVHCSSHVLNLVLQDATCEVRLVWNTTDLIHDMGNFVTDPKQLAMFTNLKREDSSTLFPLCPTRRTLWMSSNSSLLNNYQALSEALQ